MSKPEKVVFHSLSDREKWDRMYELLLHHGICKDCGQLFEHHYDESFASCGCSTSEWTELTPHMVKQVVADAVDSVFSDADKLVDELAELSREGETLAAFSMRLSQAHKGLAELIDNKNKEGK